MTILRRSLIDGSILELEVDLIFIKYGMLLENGDKPTQTYQENISKRMTFLDLKILISKKFEI